MKKLMTVRKEDLQKLIEGVPDGAEVFILTTVHDVGRALAATANGFDPDDKRDPSEVVLAIEGPMAYNQAAGVYYLVAGHLERSPAEDGAAAAQGDNQSREEKTMRITLGGLRGASRRAPAGS